VDGFRALAHVGPYETRLISRRGNVYKRLTDLAAAIHIELDCEAVVDGEIVCLDQRAGRSSMTCCGGADRQSSYAFDLLWLDGEDLRSRPLLERKRLLRQIVPPQPSVMLYATHIDRNGVKFYRPACAQDRGARQVLTAILVTAIWLVAF